MFQRIFRPKVLLSMLSGAVIGGVLFALGDADDAPGLSFIGLAAAFLLIMRGVYHTDLLPRGLHLPIVLAVFGLTALAFPFILYLDGEIRLLSPVSLIGWPVGLMLTVSAYFGLCRHAKHPPS